MDEILDKITKIVQAYNSGEFITKEKLILMQRSLSSNIYFLTKYNIEAFEQWNSIVYNFKGSNAAGQTEAHENTPELRMTRKILEASKSVSISINNEISIMKKD